MIEWVFWRLPIHSNYKIWDAGLYRTSWLAVLSGHVPSKASQKQVFIRSRIFECFVRCGKFPMSKGGTRVIPISNLKAIMNRYDVDWDKNHVRYTTAEGEEMNQHDPLRDYFKSLIPEELRYRLRRNSQKLVWHQIAVRSYHTWGWIHKRFQQSCWLQLPKTVNRHEGYFNDNVKKMRNKNPYNCEARRRGTD